MLQFIVALTEIKLTEIRKWKIWKKKLQVVNINTQFQCSLKWSAHLDMSYKHFKENKKRIFLVYINEHIPPIII